MSYDGTIIPVTQMILLGVKLLLLNVLHRQSNRAMILPVGRGWRERYPFSQIQFDCCIGTIVPSALCLDVGPLSVQSLGHSPFIGLRQAGLTTQAICRQALFSHSLESRRSQSDLQQWAQSAWRGRPPNLAAFVTTSHGRSSSSALESVSH